MLYRFIVRSGFMEVVLSSALAFSPMVAFGAGGSQDKPKVPPTFSVADLSFLIPPNDQSIHVAGANGKAPILSRRLVEKFTDFALRGHTGISDIYDKLIITGFRFDPCGPIYPSDWDMRKCVLPNLRLIAQVYDNGKPTTAALHMVFVLGVKVDQDRAAIVRGQGFDPSIRTEVIKSLLDMKWKNTEVGIETAGVPVGVHPAFTGKQADTSRSRAFREELDQFMRRYAQESAYFTTAVMFTAEYPAQDQKRAAREQWVWQKANVVRRNPKTGQPLEAPELVFGGIPGFAPDAKEQSFSADLNHRTSAEPNPPSPLENEGIPNAAISTILRDFKAIEWGKLQRAVDVADAMENPARSFVQTEDCVSCHVATTARTYALQDGRISWLKRPNEFHLAQTSGLVSTLAPEDSLYQRVDGYKIMSLGYFKGHPSIGQRTINETLQAAYLLNQKTE